MPARPRSATLLLIAVATLLRLAWAATLEVSTDEAYNWLYTLHPALSYFDHPPMTMWVGWAGIAACGGWVHPLSLRLGFVLLCAGSTWFLFRWTEDWFGGRAGFWAAAGFTLTHYFTAFGGPFALPDSPLLFFALLTWWQASRALDDRGDHRPKVKLRAWLLAGVGFGGAMLSKYHGVLLPAGVLAYVLLTRPAWKALRAPGPYLAAVVGGLLFAPVLVWNAQNGWASFRFQGGRVGAGATTAWHGGQLVWLVGPVLYLLPWVWFWLVVEFGRRVWRLGRIGDAERMAVVFAAVPLTFFFVTSCFTGLVLPHWPLVGFVPLYPLLGARLEALRAAVPGFFRVMIGWWVVAEVVILAVLLVQVKTGVIPVPRGVVDTTRAYSGWDMVAAELDARGLLGDPDLFLVTNQWDHSGQLAFAIRNRRPVTCYHTFDARGFAVWSRPEDYVGRTGLMVVVDEESEAATRREYEPLFERMAVAADFPMTRGGRPFRTVKVYRCERQTKPYPFDYTDRKK